MIHIHVECDTYTCKEDIYLKGIIIMCVDAAVCVCVCVCVCVHACVCVCVCVCVASYLAIL